MIFLTKKQQTGLCVLVYFFQTTDACLILLFHQKFSQVFQRLNKLLESARFSSIHLLRTSSGFSQHPNARALQTLQLVAVWYNAVVQWKLPSMLRSQKGDAVAKQNHNSKNVKPKHWIRIVLIALFVAIVIATGLKLLAFSTTTAIWGAIALGGATVVYVAYKVVAHATRK